MALEKVLLLFDKRQPPLRYIIADFVNTYRLRPPETGILVVICLYICEKKRLYLLLLSDLELLALACSCRHQDLTLNQVWEATLKDDCLSLLDHLFVPYFRVLALHSQSVAFLFDRVAFSIIGQSDLYFVSLVRFFGGCTNNQTRLWLILVRLQV